MAEGGQRITAVVLRNGFGAVASDREHSQEPRSILPRDEAMKDSMPRFGIAVELHRDVEVAHRDRPVTPSTLLEHHGNRRAEEGMSERARLRLPERPEDFRPLANPAFRGRRAETGGGGARPWRVAEHVKERDRRFLQKTAGFLELRFPFLREPHDHVRSDPYRAVACHPVEKRSVFLDRVPAPHRA